MPKKNLLILIAILIFSQNILAQTPINETVKRYSNPDQGFNWSYYLYIPYQKITNADSVRILIMPNNSGKENDTLEFHDKKALRDINNNRDFGDDLGVIILTPVFPRSAEDWENYTHALDRSTMITKNQGIERLDLQLIAMINDTKKLLQKKKINVNTKVLFFGFSASGMFSNRFTVLHPELVKAVVIGSPGGWPIAPIKEWKGTALRYPIGISDLPLLCGEEFKAKEFTKVALFIFLGDQDDNDSVINNDGYDPEDKNIIFELFGELPVNRWKFVEEIYNSITTNCQLKLYENVGHKVNSAMWKDIKTFLQENM